MGCPRRCRRAALVEQICGALVGRCSSLGGVSHEMVVRRTKTKHPTWDVLKWLIFKVLFGEYIFIFSSAVLRGYQAASRAMLWFDAAIFLADAECAKPLTAWGCYAQVNDPGIAWGRQFFESDFSSTVEGISQLLAEWRSIQCTLLLILPRISCKLLFSRRLWCRLLNSYCQRFTNYSAESVFRFSI